MVEDQVHPLPFFNAISPSIFDEIKHLCDWAFMWNANIVCDVMCMCGAWESPSYTVYGMKTLASLP